MKAVIITPCISSKIKDVIDIEKEDFVICADNSFVKALGENIRIDLIIGDFDTGTPSAFPIGTEILKFPIEKDDTDTMLCIKEAEKRGFTEIVIVGGLSGRLDHTFANIQSIAYGKANGLNIKISDGENEVFLIHPGKITLAKKDGFSLSVFAYGDNVEGVCERGVKYPVENVALTSSFPLGVSNEIIADEAEISLSKGLLLIILSKFN